MVNSTLVTLELLNLAVAFPNSFELLNNDTGTFSELLVVLLITTFILISVVVLRVINKLSINKFSIDLGVAFKS